MTKTSAAKRFAKAHGVYNRETRTYTKSAVFDYRNDYKRMKEQRDEARRRHAADLRIVMSLLGVEDQYEDTVATQTVFTGSYILAHGTQEIVTETAVQKFAKDLHAAQLAIAGEAALKRLRKAIKTVQKRD